MTRYAILATLLTACSTGGLEVPGPPHAQGVGCVLELLEPRLLACSMSECPELPGSASCDFREAPGPRAAFMELGNRSLRLDLDFGAGRASLAFQGTPCEDWRGEVVLEAPYPDWAASFDGFCGGERLSGRMAARAR